MTPLERSQHPVTTSRWRWFDHASMGPLTAPAAAAMGAWAQATAAEGRMAAPLDVEARCRALGATLLGVPASDIALVRNTTDGIGIVAGGVPWREGDRVVVPREEFPSNLYPWLALRDRGVQVDVVPLDELVAEIGQGPRPRVVAVSWVQHGHGERVDLAEVASAAHRRGALVVADVMQGAGVLPAALADWEVDVAVAGGHKWLLGPSGSGLAYFGERARAEVAPVAVGWAAVVERASYDDYPADEVAHLWPDARRYEGGTPAIGPLAGLAASMEVLVAAGIERIWAQVDALCDELVAGLAAPARVLSDRAAERRSGIVSIELDGADPAVVAARLVEEHGVVVKARRGGVRFAPHAYLDTADVDVALRAIHAIARS